MGSRPRLNFPTLTARSIEGGRTSYDVATWGEIGNVRVLRAEPAPISGSRQANDRAPARGKMRLHRLRKRVFYRMEEAARPDRRARAANRARRVRTPRQFLAEFGSLFRMEWGSISSASITATRSKARHVDPGVERIRKGRAAMTARFPRSASLGRRRSRAAIERLDAVIARRPFQHAVAERPSMKTKVTHPLHHAQEGLDQAGAHAPIGPGRRRVRNSAGRARPRRRGV